MHEHKLQQMIESTIRYLHKSASDMHPRDIYFSELIKDENLNEHEVEKIASHLEENGVFIHSNGVLNLIKYMHPQIIENEKKQRTSEWLRLISV